MLDVARSRFVTAYFPQLQGLNALPWAAYCAADLAWDAGWLSWLPRNAILSASTYGVLGLALALWAQWRVGQYYRRTYGSVTPDPAARRTGITVMAVVGYLVLTGWLRQVPGLPDVGLLFVAGCLAWIAYANRPFRPHFVILAIGAGLLALMPLLAWPLPTLQFVYGGALTLGLVIAGIGDHWLLARTLPGPAPLAHANAR